MKNSSLLTIIGTLAVLSVGVAISVRPASTLTEKRTQPAVAKKAPPVTKPAFQIGEIVSIQAFTALLLATTPVAGATAQRLELANDGEGLAELVRARLLWYARAKHARVLGFDAYPEESWRLGCTTDWIQVRLVDGPNAGMAGWVAATDLRRGK